MICVSYPLPSLSGIPLQPMSHQWRSPPLPQCMMGIIIPGWSWTGGDPHCIRGYIIIDPLLCCLMQPTVVVAATYFYIVVVREHFAGVIGIFSILS